MGRVNYNRGERIKCLTFEPSVGTDEEKGIGGIDKVVL